MREAWAGSRRTRRRVFWGLWLLWAGFGSPGNLVRTAFREPTTYMTPAYLTGLVLTLAAGMLAAWLMVSVASLALFGLGALARKVRRR